MEKLMTFLKEVRLEVKKVNWPTREETIKLTLVVLGATLAVAVFLGGLDLVFSTILNNFIIK